MTGFQFILASLACYRLTVCFARDLGPWQVFKRLRAVPRLGLMLGCHFCVSVWIAAVIEAAFFFSGYRDAPVVIACSVLAMSATTIALDRIFTSDHQT